ncbi:hypothetical protein ABZ656_33940 [Streptomyces sp. NPDC007095]|uniref:hypothetical protein n=1 Tax=Streptomyces sp. NPDC007095 TaxID=3154482 RepID=UPI0033D02F8E
MHARTLPRHARTGLLALGWRKARPHQGEDPDGLYPVWPILGGAPDGDGDGDGGGDQGDDGDGSDTDDDGDGDQGDDGGDWSAVVKQWKAEGLKPAQIAERLKASRKWEQRAKKNSDAADELARLRREGMSEQEAAVAAARAEERVKGGERIARSAFLAAAKGRIPDPTAVVEEINLKKYVDDDGEVDDDAIAALVDKLAPKKSGKDENDEDDDREDERDKRRRRGRGFDQGTRRGGKGGKGGVSAGADLYRELLGKGADKS